MSWITRVQNDLVIRTGDGAEYRPQYINARRDVEWNISEFNFRDVRGSFIRRGQQQGFRYDTTIMFQGDDHLDVADAFEVSSRNRNPWRILHPYYGSISVHPTSLNFDNSGHNVTRITGTLIETIQRAGPFESTSALDQVREDKQQTDTAAAQDFASKANVSASDQAVINDTVSGIANNSENLANTAESSATLSNTVANAERAIANAGSDPLAAIAAVQRVINIPAQLAGSVTQRLALIRRNFETLLLSIQGGEVSRTQKNYYQSAGASLVSSAALATLTNTGNSYQTTNEVTAVIDKLSGLYNDYISAIEDIESPDIEAVGAFVPSTDVISSVYDSVSNAVSGLQQIAYDASRLRTIRLDRYSNVIELTHKYFGIDEEDENIEKFIKINSISLNEMLMIEKGREITYFV